MLLYAGKIKKRKLTQAVLARATKRHRTVAKENAGKRNAAEEHCEAKKQTAEEAYRMNRNTPKRTATRRNTRPMRSATERGEKQPPRRNFV